jgi:hypothetical protein
MRHFRDNRITIIAFTVFFIALGGYAFFEARGILMGPQIDIAKTVLQIREPSVAIQGTTKHIASLSMNGAPVSVTEDGAFDQTYIASTGYNRVTLQAHDKYGNSKERTIEIVYTPDTISAGHVSMVAAAATAISPTRATTTEIISKTQVADATVDTAATSTSASDSNVPPEQMTTIQ